jgi:hypothetical protein
MIMPISPKDLFSKVNYSENLEKEIKEFDQYIEINLTKYLTTKVYNNQYGITISYSTNLKQKVVDEVISQYEKSGWEIKKEYCQNDGNWLIFRTKQEAQSN